MLLHVLFRYNCNILFKYVTLRVLFRYIYNILILTMLHFMFYFAIAVKY